MRVRFTPTERAELLATLAYIRREDPSAAVRFRQRAEDALRRVEQFPESGRVVPEFPDLPSSLRTTMPAAWLATWTASVRLVTLARARVRKTITVSPAPVTSKTAHGAGCKDFKIRE